MHEHIQESFLSGRRTKGNFACCFHTFLQIFEGLSAENLQFRREGMTNQSRVNY